MSGELADRWAVVTGASRGIGAAIARDLDRAGARLVLVGTQEESLRSVAGDLRRPAEVVAVDLARPDGPAAVVAHVASCTDRLHVLVNNAGTAVRCPVDDLDADTVDHLLAVNVRAPLLLVAGLAPLLRAAGGASVVNVSSVSGLVGTGHRAAYAATKGAIDAATRSLARELGPDGVRANSVAPGVVDTRLWAANKERDGVVEAVDALTPLARWAQPEDIAPVVTFLASDGAGFVTGETISVDGGMARTLPLPTGSV